MVSKVPSIVDAILFLDRFYPFPNSLAQHISNVKINAWFGKKNEDFLTELIHYMCSILDQQLCQRLIKWPLVNRKAFFQDIQSFHSVASKDPKIGHLPKAKASSLCFPSTSKDYEHQQNFIFQTALVVLENLIERLGYDKPVACPASSSTEKLKHWKSEESKAIKTLVANHHKRKALTERNESMKELIKGKPEELLTRFSNALDLPEDVKIKLRNEPGRRCQTITEFTAPFLRKRELLDEIKKVSASVRRELHDVKGMQMITAKVLSILKSASMQQLGENNGIDLLEEGKVSLLGLFQIHRLILKSRIEVLDLATNSPALETLRGQKDELSSSIERAVKLSESLDEDIAGKERSVAQLRDKCVSLKRELEEESIPPAYRPSFSLHDSLRFSDSIRIFSPERRSESRDSIIENIKRNIKKRQSTASHCSNNSSFFQKACLCVNDSISEVLNGAQEPLSSSSPISERHLGESQSNCLIQSFLDETTSLIEDVLPQLRLASLQCSEASVSSGDDQFELGETRSAEPDGERTTPANDVIRRYLEFKRRLQL